MRYVRPVARRGSLDQSRIYAVQHQFGAAKHRKRTGGAEVAPRQIQETLASLTVHRGALEVDGPIVLSRMLHLEHPAGGWSVAGHQLLGCRADLHTDVHLIEWLAIRKERTTGQIASDDDYLHGASLSER
jgi:hypothetical protein